MVQHLQQQLLEAAGKEKAELAADNPYKTIGFDADTKRLGWVKSVAFSLIKKSLENLADRLDGKESFIFIGMGGSINGMKPLFALFPEKPFYTLDNLDPAALSGILERIKDLDKTLVVAISKSGTTKETQLLAESLKELLIARCGQNSWSEKFLWLSDPDSFRKLDESGWEEAKKVPIQFDASADIGGRFSSPQTLIFFLPLFLLLSKDWKKLEKIYGSFVSLQEKIRQKAYLLCEQYKNKPDAYFSPFASREFGGAFSSWIVQLFQESLGSKLKDFPVKTLTRRQDSKLFTPLKLELAIDDPVVALMGQMYFFQIFIAYYSACRQINFVTQEFVEKYKQQMQKLQENGFSENTSIMDLHTAAQEISGSLRPEHKFIEVVLYLFPPSGFLEAVEKRLSREFSSRQILVFIGSDWNHQSYQAAFGSKDTLYVLLFSSGYLSNIAGISTGALLRNINALKTIARATHLTLQDKSLLAGLEASGPAQGSTPT